MVLPDRSKHALLLRAATAKIKRRGNLTRRLGSVQRPARLKDEGERMKNVLFEIECDMLKEHAFHPSALLLLTLFAGESKEAMSYFQYI